MRIREIIREYGDPKYQQTNVAAPAQTNTAAPTQANTSPQIVNTTTLPPAPNAPKMPPQPGNTANVTTTTTPISNTNRLVIGSTVWVPGKKPSDPDLQTKIDTLNAAGDMVTVSTPQATPNSRVADVYKLSDLEKLQAKHL